MNYLIRARYVVAEKILREGAVVVEDGVIAKVGEAAKLSRQHPRYERIDAENGMLIPGLINTHTHAAMSIFRGYAEDLALESWLERIWPVEDQLKGRDIYLGAKLAASEALLGGTTTLVSMYFYTDDRFNEAKAFYDAGIRGIVGHTIFEGRAEDDFHTTRRFVERWHGYRDGRIRVCVAPHSAYSVAPETLRRSGELADELNEQPKGGYIIPTTIHVAESKDEVSWIRKRFKVDASDGVAAYLMRIGALTKNIIAAHCIYVTAKDLAVMRKHGISVSSNPTSNLKVGMGVAPIVKMLKTGVNISLGTDGAASNNSLDMFEAMKLTPLLQKGLSGDASQITVRQAFAFATSNGARAIGMAKELGAVREGYKADLAILDLKRPNASPMYDPYSYLVYAAKGGDVSHVFVDGELVVEEFKLVKVELEELLENVNTAKEDLLSRAGET